MSILSYKKYLLIKMCPFCLERSQLFSGMPLIEMEFTGIAFLSTGYICLSSKCYLFQQGLQFPFPIQALRF